MKNLEKKDQNFLIIFISVIVILTGVNFPLLIKSLATSKFSNPQLKTMARNIELPQFKKDELALWNHFKEINSEEIDQNFASNSVELELPEIPPLVEDISIHKSTENINLNQKESYDRFLLIGDSTMYDLSVILNYDLRILYRIKNVRLDYRVSTGLNRIDYYNWFEKTPQFIEGYQADVLIVIFGGNDDQDILDSQGEYHSTLSQDWQQTYRERVEKYAQILSNSSVKKVYWIGQPISNVGRFNKFYPVLNQIYQEVSTKHPKIEFVDTWNAFAIKGNFSPIMPDKSGKKAYVRISDGVHFTEHGARILGELVIDQMVKDQIISKK